MGSGGTMDGCGRCMKFSLICLNVITFVVGVIMIGIGAWVWVSRSFASTLLSSNLFIGSVILVVAMGVAVLFLSILGCCGAAKEVKCMLLTYYIFVFIIFVATLASAIILFVFREKVTSSLDREMFAAIPYYGVKHEYTVSWDDTQTLLQCCGVRSYKDWNDNVPDSCCKEVYPGKRLDCRTSPNPTTMYMEGCINKTMNILKDNAAWVAIIALVIVIIMLVALILSCGLFVKIE